jgi:CDP-diacylglycerol--glycerol-3-phosphate 3-phosphatidyltransferase
MRRSAALNVPNLLTYARLAAVPAVVALLFWPRDDWMRWAALVIFIAAGLTDYFDGYLARIYAQQSALGRMLDPIADKLLVASCLLMLVNSRTIQGYHLWAAIVILCREILVSGLREYLAGLRVGLPVSRLAKWKTAIQMVAIGVLIVGDAGPGFLPVTAIGEIMLWVAALLTILTGYDYLRAGLQHMDNPAPAPAPAKTSRVL